MYRVLVVDDEKLERDGIRFLLSMEEGEWEIYEAANGKLALNELRKHPVDLMLTDIKMPHMDGLELSKKAREEYPDLEIIIFSGYGDFAFAQEAIRYGVTDYVLKPVDPDRFHDTIQKIQKEIASRKNKEQQSIKEKSFLQQYFLLGYIYSGDQERLKEAEGIVDFSVWEQWHCAILIESDEAFFDSASDEVPIEIREELRRSFFYLNLNGRQSLLLFKDVYCDYVLVAKNVYNLLKRLHPVRFHLAVAGVLTDIRNCRKSWNSWSSRWKKNFIIRISMSTPARRTRKKIPEKRSRIPGLWKKSQKIFPERM
jgi:two-component system response regulator YesN